jgi:hypothetical protein
VPVPKKLQIHRAPGVERIFDDRSLRNQDIVNKYAKDMTAQKYSKAVIMVSTVLSDTLIDLNRCIFSMRYWIYG